MKIPILIKDNASFIAKIKDDMKVEEKSVVGYEATIKLAPDKYKDVLQEILDDEKDHIEKLNKILEDK
jgi:rubrerythrin